jgi:hypothetical protein
MPDLSLHSYSEELLADPNGGTPAEPQYQCLALPKPHSGSVGFMHLLGGPRNLD